MAANPAMIVKIQANIEEFKRSLAEGHQQIAMTTAGISKMVAGLQGDKLLQYANNIVVAVQSIGGAAKLTEAEQARHNATLEKAIEKYRVLGKDPPKALLDLAEATRHVEEETAHAGDTAMSLKDQYVQMFSGASTKGMHGLATGILDDANAITGAIAEIGGAAHLTDAEQARVNKTVGEAVAKYQALGQQAPPAMVALQQATAGAAERMREANTQTVAWTTQLRTLGAAIGVTFSAAAIVGFGRELLRMGDQIVRVADQTGMTTTEVQKLSYIAQQSGNTIEQLTGAMSKMQANLGSGDAGTIGAVRALGLNLDKLRAASPYQQMAMIAEAANKIEDPMLRAATMTELFGKAGVQNIPTLISNFKALGDAAPQMSDQTVRALDRAGDSLNRFKLQLKVWAAESYNWLRGGFESIIAIFLRFQANLMDLTAIVVEQAGRVPLLGKALGVLGISAETARKNAQELRDMAAGMGQSVATAGAQTQGAATHVQTMGERVKALLTPALEKLSSEQKTYIAQMEAAGVSTQKMAGALSVSEDAVKLFTDRLKENKKLMEEISGVKLLKELHDLETQWQSLTPAVQSNSMAMGLVTAKYEQLRPELTTLSPTLEAVRNEVYKVDDAMVANARLVYQAALAAGGATDTWAVMQAGAVSLGSGFGNLDSHVGQTTETVGKSDAAFQQLLRTQSIYTGDIVYAVNATVNQAEAMHDAARKAHTLSQSFHALLKLDFKNFGAGFTEFLRGGLGSIKEGFFEGIGKKLMDGVSGLISMGLGAIVAGFKKLFGGPSAEELAGREIVAAFEKNIQAMLTAAQKLEAGNESWKMTVIGVRDAYLAMGLSSEEALAAVERLWAASKEGPEAAKAAIAEIQAVLDAAKKKQEELNAVLEKYAQNWEDLPKAMQAERQQSLLKRLKNDFDLLTKAGFDYKKALELIAAKLTDQEKLMLGITQQAKVDWRAMEEAAKKYGIALDKLGPAFDQAKIDDKAEEIVKDFKMLSASGADVGAVVNGMADEFNELLHEALRTGAKLPDSLRPLAEALIESGQLTDLQGQKLESLGDVSFADPVVSGFDKIVDKLDELITLLGRPLEDALTDQPDLQFDIDRAAVDKIIDEFNNTEITIKVKFDPEDLPEFQHGTYGQYADFGPGTLAVLHGRERIMTEREQITERIIGQPADFGPLAREMRAVRQMLRDQPRAIAVAVRDAALLVGGGR